MHCFLSGFPNHCNGAEGIDDFGDLCKYGHVRQAKGGGNRGKPWYPHPTLETNKQTLSLVPGKNHESTPCKLQIKCQDDVSHICHVTRSQYAFQQGSVCIKNNVNICKTNKALGTDFFPGVSEAMKFGCEKNAPKNFSKQNNYQKWLGGIPTRVSE